MSQFAQHFHIVGHTLVQTLCFVGLTDFFKVGYLLGQIVFNLMNGAERTFLGGHEQVGRINLVFFERTDTVS
jgi:hypothetical protein